jgi:hypothetical protein
MLAANIGSRSFERDPIHANDPYHRHLVEIDKFLFRWRCPLGHLDAQLFYDLLCCQTLWENFEKVLRMSGLDTSGIPPGDPEASVFWQVLGLACLDPWKNTDESGAEHTGFRHRLQNDINAAGDFGFELNDEYKEQIQSLLKKPGLLDALQDIAMCWVPTSEAMLLRREEYPRLQPVELPQGWVDLTKP